MSFIISSFIFCRYLGAMYHVSGQRARPTTFKSSMTYEILLIVVVAAWLGVGSIIVLPVHRQLRVAAALLDNETWEWRLPVCRCCVQPAWWCSASSLWRWCCSSAKGIMGDRELFQKKEKPASRKKLLQKGGAFK
ncbi:MAG: hypothetical protein ACLVJH_12590 [Faecalibacterium prausnitzii]